MSNRTDADLLGVIFAKETRIHHLEALLRRAARRIRAGHKRSGGKSQVTEEFLTEIEAVLATSQHKKDAEDA